MKSEWGMIPQEGDRQCFALLVAAIASLCTWPVPMFSGEKCSKGCHSKGVWAVAWAREGTVVVSVRKQEQICEQREVMYIVRAMVVCRWLLFPSCVTSVLQRQCLGPFSACSEPGAT